MKFAMFYSRKRNWQAPGLRGKGPMELLGTGRGRKRSAQMEGEGWR